jgi:hypothetical protein
MIKNHGRLTCLLAFSQNGSEQNGPDSTGTRNNSDNNNNNNNNSTTLSEDNQLRSNSLQRL